MNRLESHVVNAWKAYTLKMVRRRFGHTINLKKVEKYLDKMIEEEMEVPRCYIVNNLRRKVVNTDIFTLFKSIKDTNMIIGGAATMFVQHDRMPNPMRDFILWNKDRRTKEKKTRDTFERGVSDEWNRWDIAQNNTKVIMNSLYGVLGYAKFIFHNIFLAESITRMGRVIISTAACGFENFLADNIIFSTSSELFEYVSIILDEYEEKYKDKMSFDFLQVDISPDQVISRLMDKCGFPIEANTREHLMAIINRLSKDELILLFYKNNFMKFNRIPAIQDKLRFIFSNINELRLPALNKVEREDVRDEIQDLWSFYDCFVFYNHPIFDSVRKMAYGTREGVLYIDTDSNFIALNRWVQQIGHEVFQDKLPQEEKAFVFTVANVVTMFLTIVVDRNLKMFARNCNISEEWVKFLSMKNEFFFWRILFGEVKKRYVDLQMIQEGKILNDGKGLPEIKGYDFRKSVTKQYVRDFYTNLCMNEILSAETIDMQKILMMLNQFKQEIRRSMLAGESMFFKQASVNPPKHYANPLQISGIKGVMLWNALCPEYAIELPANIDLIPIRNLATEKNRQWLKDSYPAVYDRLEREIFNNRNPKIAEMTLNVIARPRNSNVPMPDWLMDVMDVDSIVNSTMKLIIPIMESLGLKIQKPTSNKQFLTNLVDL